MHSRAGVLCQEGLQGEGHQQEDIVFGLKSNEVRRICRDYNTCSGCRTYGGKFNHRKVDKADGWQVPKRWYKLSLEAD